MTEQPIRLKQRGVLFDVDGTLVDTTYLHTLSWWQAIRRQGMDIPMASIHRHIGMGGDKILSRLLPLSIGDDVRDTIKSDHGAVFSTFWPAIRAFDSARALLRSCADSGLKVALATSAQERDLKVLRTVLDAEAWIDCATSSADASESKPSPDILKAALKRLELDAEDVVFVGDSVWDVEAAARLGIGTIALTCGGVSEAELRSAGAIEVYEDPHALLHGLEDSAIGRLAVRRREPKTEEVP
ncbi:HAD family hydrolase [bacterium RCC_150]